MQSSLDVQQKQKCGFTTRQGSPCTRDEFEVGAGACKQHAGLAGARTPTGITAEQQTEFFRLLEDGLSLDHAASLAAISRSTVYDWLKRAKDPQASAVYRDFAAGVEVSRAKLEQLALRSLARAARGGDWKAGARLLEMLDPVTYGRRGAGRPAGQISMGELGASAGDNPRNPDNVIPLPVRAGGDW